MISLPATPDIPALTVPSPSQVKKAKAGGQARTTRLLRIDASYFVAGAVFERADATSPWRCAQAAPIVKWMVGKSPSYIVNWLNFKGHSWEWL